MSDAFTAALAGAPFGKLAKRLGKKTRKAHHGSPHDFDAFDINKIGTGEGAQAYGHGLYFTSKEDIAKHYRDGLTAATDDLPPFRIIKGSDEARIRADLHDYGEYLETHPDFGQVLQGGNLSGEHYRNAGKQILDALDRGDLDDAIRLGDNAALQSRLAEVSADAFPRGKLYEVEIPDESMMLDWDKPLSEQPESVREALKTLLPNEPYQDAQGYWRVGGYGMYFDEGEARKAAGTGAWEDALGQTIYEFLGDDDAAISAQLRELGIPGITYKGVTSGERNFVVFDDAMTNIVSKGMATPEIMALTGGAALAGGLGQQAWNALPQQNEQPWYQGHSAGDWAKAVPDAGMDFLNAIVRPSAVGGATVLDYLHGWPAEKMDQRAAGRDAKIDYQPRTELGAKLSERGGDAMMNVLADLIRPMMPSPYTQRQLEAFMGKAEKTAPRELRALGGAADYLDWIF